MSLIKRVLPILVFLLLVAIAWIGFSIYFQSADLEVDSKATIYTRPINSTFNTEIIEEVSTRTSDSFPVSPDEFLRLNQLD